jgi:hypothetical protein
MNAVHPTLRALRRPLLTLTLVTSLVAATFGVAQTAGAAAEPGHVHHHTTHHGHLTGTVQRDLAQVRAAVARYHTPERATAAGWQLLPGLDHCFEHPEAGGMGVHFIDPDQLGNGTLDPSRPEALVFVPGPHGQLRLGAVEYIVPIADPDDPGEAPSVLGHDLHRLEPVPGVHVWGLHVWLFESNPAGMFADWNPRVSCDALTDPVAAG